MSEKAHVIASTLTKYFSFLVFNWARVLFVIKP